MVSFAQFFSPYILFLLGAAYNIEQTLEGLKIRSSNFLVQDADGNIVQSYWSPHEATIPILVIMLLYSLLLVGLIVVAAYIWGRWKGSVTALLLLALPGLVATFGLEPNIDYLPYMFVIDGTGTLGGAWGMFSLVLLGLSTGWSVVLILSDLLDFRDKFRHYYDHFWYAMAILTGVFFVGDSHMSQVVRELQQANQSARQASAYLLQQVRAYDLQCQQDPSIGTVSCTWASDVQQMLSDYATQGEQNFPWQGPKSSAEIYGPFGQNLSPEEILAIRSELKAYNDSRCPVKELGQGRRLTSRSSATCQRPPPSFCSPSFPEPLDGHVETAMMLRAVAIASECIIPSLVASRKTQEELSAVVADSARTKHFRWLFYVLVSFVVGGKIANATSRVIELDKRPEHEKRRLVGLLRSVWLGAKNVVRWAIKVCRVVLGYVFSRLYRIACALWLGAKNGMRLAIKVCRVVLGYVFSRLHRVACALRKL